MSETHENHPAGGIPENLRNELHRHEALCLEMEQLPGRNVEDYAAELERLAASYKELPEIPPEYAEILDKRFAEARKLAELAAKEAEERSRKHHAKIQNSAALHMELEKLLEAGDLVVPSEVDALWKKWEAATAELSDEEAAREAFMAKFAPLKERMDAEVAAETARSEAAEKLTEELVALTAGEDMNLLKERKSAIETEYAALGTVPKASADKYRHAHHKAAVKLAQHFETLDFARWESFTLKQDICNELDRMQEQPDSELPRLARRLQELRDKWKELGSVPKVKADEINPRYLESTRKLQHRIDEYYAHVRAQQKQAAASKKELCEKAAALADSTEWNAGSTAFKELQAAWKELPLAGSQEKALFAEFRVSADKFFNARNAYFNERNTKFEEVAAAKKKVIEEAEALAAAGTGDPARVRRAKELRAEFMAPGRAGRSEVELEKRFNAAMDQFFGARREAFAEREELAKKLIDEVRSLAENITDAAAVEARGREIDRELKELACRKTFNAEQKAFDALGKALGAARGRVLTDKFTLYKSVSLLLAEAFEKMEPGEITIEYLDRFPKLLAAAKLIEQAAAGDEDAKKRLDKQAEHAASEQSRICGELEKIVGIESEGESQETAGTLSLADELAAAIAGNFAASSVKAEAARAKSVDPKQLLSEFMGAGLPEKKTLESATERFDNAYGKLR